MALIEAINLTHSFGDKVLYLNSSFELFKGEHMGIVGQNGTGKTTLLNTISGEIIPDKGEIRVQNNIRIGYLDQYVHTNTGITIFEYLQTAFADLYEIENTLTELYNRMGDDFSEETIASVSDYQSVLENRGFYEIESKIMKVADGLGITAMGMESFMGEISGGQRARVILAKLLLEQPDLLLLDEPTNFLDKEHVEWLTGILQAFPGAFIVISHDFAFLDQVTTCICDIEHGMIEKYYGNFSKFLKLKEMKRENYANELAAQQRQIKQLEEFIAKNKARASTAGMARGRQKQLDKIERMSELSVAAKPNFKFTSLPVTSEKVLSVRSLTIGYDTPLLSNLSFELTAGEKVVITGFNGIGKSTLLKTLLGQIPAWAGRFRFGETIKIGYLQQELEWENDEQTAVQIVMDHYPKLPEKQVRKYLAQCGIPAKNAVQAVATLSGGEQSKIKLCVLMLTQANLLILDEPTNHLDKETKEVLQQELQKWQGSILLVSHEAAFYEDWADRIIPIGEMS